MADGEDIVNDPYSPPHRYGSTIWDIFRPRPGAERDLQNNLYGMGYNPGQPSESQITPERSPFGKLLQGVGIIGSPDPRPLTDYEKMIVQEGAFHKGQEDYQTEKQRLDRLNDAFGIGAKAIEAGGQVPSRDTLGLPEDMYGDLANYAVKSGEEAKYQRELRKQHLEKGQKDIQHLDWMMGEVSKEQQAKRHMDLINSGLNSPVNRAAMIRYDKLMQEAYAEADIPTRKKKLEAAQKIHQQLVEQMRAFDATDKEILVKLGAAPDPNAALQGAADPRELDNPAAVKRMYDASGMGGATPDQNSETFKGLYNPFSGSYFGGR